MRAALDFLLRHELRREFRTESLSDHLNLSPSRVQHLFQQHLGMSPTQVFKLRQMETAKDLLDSTFLRVKEVMAAAGRHDPSHFVRDFKRMFGYTPAQRRKPAASASTRHGRPRTGTNQARGVANRS
jgi:AraC-like DNA-binding protein